MIRRRNQVIDVDICVMTEAEAEYLVLGCAEVSPYDPGVCSGPVEACYPPEGGEVELRAIWLVAGPSPGARMNDVAIEPAMLDRFCPGTVELLEQAAFEKSIEGEYY